MMLLKPWYNFTGMYLRGPSGETATKEEMSKIDKLVRTGLVLLQEHIEKYDGQRRHSKLMYKSVQLDEEQEVGPDAAKFVIYVEDFNDDKTNAHAIRNRAEMRVPKWRVKLLPNHIIVGALSKQDQLNYEWLMNHFLHEILHVLGAFHSTTGIMSGIVTLIENNVICLWHHLDPITERIIAMTLAYQISATRPDILCKHLDGEVKIWANFPIHIIVFLDKSFYTTQYYFGDSGNEFKCRVYDDLEWNAIFVQLEYGGSAYFIKDHLDGEMREAKIVKSRV